jgi:Cof subfamily protein (haloacid dehalogenase superfamily)
MDRIALVISDVDGTLVTTQKQVTERTKEAVAKLQARGIGFTLVSSRPPFGLRSLIAMLNLHLPVAAFNGGALATPDLTILQQHPIDRAVAGAVVDFLSARGVGVWVFTTEAWLTRDAAGAHVAHETMTVDQPPAIVTNFDAVIDRAVKIVGVSDDFARLEAIEKEAQANFSGRAVASRSQRYYLDFVAPGINKGVAVRELSEAIGISLREIVTLGDMENDVPMFQQSGFSIAMGNATDSVKAEAKETTLSNDDEGFAAGIERFVLPRIGNGQ